MARPRPTPTLPAPSRSHVERPGTALPGFDDLLGHLPVAFGYLRRRVADAATAERLLAAALVAVPTGRAGVGGPRAALLGAAATAVRAHLAPAGPDERVVALFARALDPDLRAAFERLAPDRQALLAIRYVDRLGPAEAAAVTDLRPSACEARVAAAVRILAKARADGPPVAASGEAVDAA